MLSCIWTTGDKYERLMHLVGWFIWIYINSNSTFLCLQRFCLTLSCHSMHLHITLSFNAPTHYLVTQCTYTLSCHSVHLHIILSFNVPTHYLVIHCTYKLSCHSMRLHIILSFNAPTHHLVIQCTYTFFVIQCTYKKDNNFCPGTRLLHTSFNPTTANR